MSNRVRNEVDLRIGETVWRLRPTFDCMAEIEDQTDKGFIELAHAIAQERGKVKDLVIIIREGRRAAGHTPQDHEIQELIETYGTAAVQMALGDFFATALYGGPALDAESDDDSDDKKN